MARNLSESKFMQALNDYGTLCALVEDHGGIILAPKSGQELVIAPDLTVQILSPSTKKQLALADEINALYNSANVCSTFLQRLDALDARMNNYSLILRLNYRGTRILLPGDTNVTGYDGIDPADLRADLFKVGHHGQKDGVDEALAELIRPTAVVCCASSDRRYNSAHPDTMKLLADHGAALYFSDCPPVPGMQIPSHEALRFTVGPNGALDVRYLPASENE